MTIIMSYLPTKFRIRKIDKAIKQEIDEDIDNKKTSNSYLFSTNPNTIRNRTKNNRSKLEKLILDFMGND